MLHTFVQVIPAIGDWTHVASLWPAIAGGDSADLDWIQLRGAHEIDDIRELAAVECDWNYDDQGKRTTVRRVTRHGWRRHDAPVRAEPRGITT